MIYEDYAIFTPGPAKMSKAILKIGSKQTPYFRNKLFSEVVLECESILLEFLNAPANSRIIFLTASGTAGLESIVMNLLDGSSNALVVNGGGFGQRFVDICKSYKIKHQEINGVNTNLKDIGKIDAKNFNTFIVNSHETSVGHLYDLESIGQYCKNNNLLNIVDAISMFITDELDMQKQNIDAVIISSQKGLALPPGLTMVALSPMAMNNIKDINSHYFNFKNYLIDGERGQTPYTPAVTIILQLQARLKQIKADGGIKSTIKRAKDIADYFRSSIKDLPLRTYTKYMPNALTALMPAKNKSAAQIVRDLEEKNKIMICPNGGELKDTIFRVSHMGAITKQDIDKLVLALKMNL